MVDRAWFDAVPDAPRWVEVRSMLLQGDATLLGTPDAGFVLDRKRLQGGMVGMPDRACTQEALGHLAPRAEVIVPSESLSTPGSSSPTSNPIGPSSTREWGLRRQPGTRPSQSRRWTGRFSSLPEELAEEVEGAGWVAVSRVDGQAVAICDAYWPTHRWWDVGVDTVSNHRRLGHATRCFHALDTHVAQLGLDPVWGAYEDNVASLSMASSLGFEPVDQPYVLEMPQ